MISAHAHRPIPVRMSADMALSGLSAWWVVFAPFARSTSFSLFGHFRHLRSVVGQEIAGMVLQRCKNLLRLEQKDD